MLQDCLTLQAAEKSFYDVLNPKGPPSSIFIGCIGRIAIIQKKGEKKQSAASNDGPEPQELFDEVLLCQDADHEFKSCFHDQYVKTDASGKLQCNKQPKVSKAARSKTKHKNREVVDLCTMLTQCAQAVANHDQRTASELIKKIGQHSSPNGDATERLAYYFADALEVRLAGSSTPSYSPLLSTQTPATEILKAHQVYVTSCPFKKMLYFFANRTVIKLAENATRLHIIDFGISYGFQWSCLIQRLSKRPGGPPNLRITAIELPQPGFRPTERVEETMHRLEKYAERFDVPFEYTVIAQKWETIRFEDLKVDKYEMIVVNCMRRLRHIPDETVAVSSPRDTVLNLIEKINPDLFIHGVVNGTYNSPFFVTRFREAFFHYSALSDTFEATIPREDEHRLMFEKAIYGRDIMNVIACEGLERVERPETYKYWQVRYHRAGFKQVPLDQELLKKVKAMLKLMRYHNDFRIDEDGHWMLQGWKGRIIIALSALKPA
ncbi:scarecrow-like protein 14 [Malus domestica]|uniref:scarecrow-like protein 14 n=1 Tax=Malus domestica TaxID=3750 RepID=UPI0007ECD05F